ncbi:hypothetical protein K438DRAFT_1869616 [Mycena galopus ATCC 62051]|nr:hypothetical protein K438DRAFT_1869616 [Mycena galopus ATCC 62051]
MPSDISLISDSIFMYRCYVIWDSQTRPLILPVLLMLSTLVVEILGLPGTSGYAEGPTLILAAATNLVITAFTAGRILYIQRAASHVALDHQIRGRYTRAVVMILESGAINCVVAISLAITSFLNGEIFSIASAVGPRVLNIIPTFTLVYIGLSNMQHSPPADEDSRDCFNRPSTRHTPSYSVRRSSWPVVLDIKMEYDDETLKYLGSV